MTDYDKRLIEYKMSLDKKHETFKIAREATLAVMKLKDENKKVIFDHERAQRHSDSCLIMLEREFNYKHNIPDFSEIQDNESQRIALKVYSKRMSIPLFEDVLVKITAELALTPMDEDKKSKFKTISTLNMIHVEVERVLAADEVFNSIEDYMIGHDGPPRDGGVNEDQE